jgi:3',5'-cyclic AMP phosphodiesterase CpdA
MTIAHLSDLHFGCIAHPAVVATLVEEVNQAGVDLVALSGDLTQRARPREFERATAMLAAMEAPVLVVPGNHDVYPWWRPVRRLATPLRRYRRHVTRDLAPRFTREGLSVLGLSSAHGQTLNGGRINAQDRRMLRTFFDGQPAPAFRVLVVHHHLAPLQALGGYGTARQAKQTLRTAAAAGVDLVLCGHLHVSHIEPIQITPEEGAVSVQGRRLVIASAGTATSHRGRGPDRETNFYNQITVTDDAFTIAERRFVPEHTRFVTERTTTFERTRTATATPSTP